MLFKMNVIRQEQTRSSPEVILDPAGFIKFKGRSILEDSACFYEPIVEWLDEYVTMPAAQTVVDIELEYFNSATAKFIITIIQRLSTVTFRNRKLKVNWYYEEGDEDILERGEYIASVLEVDFNFIQLS